MHHRNDFRACYKAHLQSIRAKLQPEATAQPKENQPPQVDEVEKPNSVHVLRTLLASLGRVRLTDSLEAWPEKHNAEIEQLNPGHKAELDRSYKRKTELLDQPAQPTTAAQPEQTETAKPSAYEILKTALLGIENNSTLNKWALSNRQDILALSEGDQQHILDIFADLQETFAAAA